MRKIMGVLDLLERYPGSILITSWQELKDLTLKSETHTLEIDVDGCNGSINKKDSDSFKDYHYLSTHTFYEGTYEWSTARLQDCGFNVVIDNWDAEEEKPVTQVPPNSARAHLALLAGLGASLGGYGEEVFAPRTRTRKVYLHYDNAVRYCPVCKKKVFVKVIEKHKKFHHLECKTTWEETRNENS
jgi:hypothetical protein